ncbi:MAG: hypothetical protein RLZZ417_1290 [Bacteroidota bacterium]|jgi:coproporphyrinogen III oxidase
MTNGNKMNISAYFKSLQENICNQLSLADDGIPFVVDNWTRPEGGGGRSMVLNGNKIEKGGVMFSAVDGTLNEKASKGLNIPQGDFFATGVSIVLHPSNPFSPIIHMNVRHFEMDNGLWWFGGGIDLTPHYIDPKEAAFFHDGLKQVCDRHDHNFYKRFKTWADDYFFLPHRNETRGVGGIFFDRLVAAKNKTKESTFDFVKEVGESFCKLYLPLLDRTYDLPFTEKNKEWQYLRRGRYVEFNLVWDKGTKFGLETNGRTESILVSMPPMASWKYDFQVGKNSQEEKTLSQLKKGIEWI